VPQLGSVVVIRANPALTPYKTPVGADLSRLINDPPVRMLVGRLLFRCNFLVIECAELSYSYAAMRVLAEGVYGSPKTKKLYINQALRSPLPTDP